MSWNQEERDLQMAQELQRQEEEIAARLSVPAGSRMSTPGSRMSTPGSRMSTPGNRDSAAIRHSQRNPNMPVAGIVDERTLKRMNTFTGSFFGKGMDKKPIFVLAMVLACVVTMIVEILVNEQQTGAAFADMAVNPLLGPTTEVLILLGAKRSDLIVNENEGWRLIAPMFLHGGIIHLIFNMAFLWSFGSSLEREFGHWKVAYIYLCSGYFGVLMSAIFNPTVPSVGASGACYGLIGAAWADFILNFQFYAENWKTTLAQLTFGTALNVCLGFIPQLDNFAHVGGLICGFITGLSVLTLPRYDVYANLKGDKLYQIVLKSVAIFAVPVLLITFTIVLYVGVDVDSYCEWCQYISCIEFNPDWWSCGVQCEEGFAIEPLTQSAPYNVTITCPRDIGEVLAIDVPEEVFTEQSVQLATCREWCL